MKAAPPLTSEDISRLAFMNWEKDGCPPGRSHEYWLEAESQLRATWQLMIGEITAKNDFASKEAASGAHGAKNRLVRASRKI
jgi:hypothetical protein